MKMEKKEKGMKDLVLVLLATIACLLVPPSSAKAQVQTTTDISGTVSDPTGAVIPAANVTSKNQNTGAERTTITNGSGFYSFPSLQPGTYTITVTKSGFKTQVITDRVAEVAQPARVDITLAIGSTAQRVEVSAAGQELINTTTAEIAGTISGRIVSDIPLNGRNFMDLANMTPGSSNQDATGLQVPTGLSQISFAQTALNLSSLSAGGVYFTSGVFAGGNRDSASNVSIDGSNVQSALYGQAQQLQSISGISEVKVQSGIMSPEFGFGATAVNVITKGGTNSLHGEGFEFLRNDNLDAANFFTNLARRRKPEYRMNQFGASVGGPIIKEKLHFFANYEGLRLIQSTTATAVIPPAAIHNGDFSSVVLAGPGGTTLPGPTIYNPFQFDPVTGLRTPFPNNQIPIGPTTLCSPRPTCVDPVALAMLNLTPSPNTTIDGIPTLAGTQSTTVNSNQYTGRIDWDKSYKDRIFGRYTRYQTHSLAGGLMSLQGSTNPFGTYNHVISWTRTISPSLVNNLAVSYTRLNWATARRTDVGDVALKIGISGTQNNPGSPGFSIANYTLNQSLYTDAYTIENLYQFKDSLSLVKGKHIFNFGFESSERRLAFSIAGSDKGAWTYNSPLYTTPCPLGNATCTAAATAAGATGGLALADFLLGVSPNTLVLRLEGTVSHGDRRYYGGYFQDSWHILPKLTLNYGLRYEYWSPWLSARRIVARWDAATAQVVYALKNPLDYLNPATHFGRDAELTPGEVASSYTTGKNNFAPRLGLAYSLTPRTTLRAGTGIFFDGNGNQEQIAEQREAVGPFGLLYQVNDVGTDQLPTSFTDQQFATLPSPTAIAQPSLTNPISVRVMAGKYYPTPTIYEWSFSLQRRLGSAWVLELNYFGTHTIHQQQYIHLNPANLPVGPLAGVPLQQRLLYPQWGQVQSWADVGWAKYNAFTTSMQSPRWHGMTVMSWFTWSKDKVSSSEGLSDEGNNDFRLYDIWAGPSLLNPALRSVHTWNYELPVGRDRAFQPKGALDWVLGGWDLSGTAQFSQGGHQRVIAPNTSGGLQDFAMPDRVCNPDNVPGGKTRLKWFNTACFKTAAFGVYGNSPIGAVLYPGTNNWNLALAKSFRISEEKRVEFRSEFFNAFNHTQFGYAQIQTASSAFGQALSTKIPRELQFALKIIF